jgi:hypothetical protein
MIISNNVKPSACMFARASQEGAWRLGGMFICFDAAVRDDAKRPRTGLARDTLSQV